MPLFACSKCNVVENTACGEYWINSGRGLPVLCSECSPLMGNKWHGRFPRERADNGMWEPDRGHFLRRKAALPRSLPMASERTKIKAVMAKALVSPKGIIWLASISQDEQVIAARWRPAIDQYGWTIKSVLITSIIPRKRRKRK